MGAPAAVIGRQLYRRPERIRRRLNEGKIMKVIVAVIAAALLSFSVNAWSAADGIDQVVLLDVQGLRGGTNLWISGDGKAIAGIVGPSREGGSGLREIRYSFKLTREQKAALAEIVKQTDFFSITTADRYGVPDEPRPAVFIKAGGKKHAVAKWANDRHERFDPVYAFLLEVARSGKKGAVIKKAAFDGSWKPEGFPENRTIMSMTQPQPDWK